MTEPPKPEPPLPDRSVKVIYSDDMSGELSARPDNYFGSIHFETKGFADDLEVQVRVTLTRDGSPVVGLLSVMASRRWNQCRGKLYRSQLKVPALS